MSDDLGKSVRDRLKATSSVTNLVNASIHPDVLPQGASLPGVTVFVPSNTPMEDLNSTNRLGPAVVQITAFALDRATANAVAKAIRDDALPATLRGSVQGMDFKEVSLTAGPNELVDQPIDGSDQWRRCTQQTFTIWAEAT